MAVKEIVTVLKLDGKGLKTGLSETSKDVLKLSAAAAALGASMAAITKVASNYQDSMIKSARAAGTTAEAFSGLTVAAEMSGVEIDQLKTSLTKLQNQKVQEKLKELGIAVKDAGGNARDSVDIFKDFAEYISNIQNPAKKTEVAIYALGKSGGELISLLNEGKDGLEAFAQKAADMGLVVSTEAGQAAEKFNDNLEDIAKATKGLTISIGESLVAFANQSGILDTIEETIKDITQAWRNLDTGTQNTIITIVSLVAGLGTLAGALALIITVAPAVGAAFSLMFGPVGLIVAGVVASIYTVIDALKDNKTAAERAADEYQRLADNTNRTVSQQEKFLGLNNRLETTLQKLKIYGIEYNDTLETRKILMGQLLALEGKTKDAQIQTVKTQLDEERARLIEINKLQAERIKVTKNADYFINGAAFEYQEYLSMSNEDLKDQKSRRLALIGVLQAEEKLLEKEKNDIKDTVTETKNLKKNTDELTGAFRAAALAAGNVGEEFKKPGIADEIIKIAQDVIGLAQTVSTQVSGIADSMASGITRKFDKILTKLQIMNAKAEESFEITRGIVEAAQNEELKKLTEGYDAQIKALKDAEDRKVSIIENAAAERAAALDAEFQAQKARMEAEFAAYVENERIKFEAKKAILDAETADNEQRKLVDQMLEADYDLWLENEKARFEDSITNLAKTFGDQRDINDSVAKDKQEKRAKRTAKEITRLEQEKDDAITKATEKFLGNLAAMDAAEEKRQKAAQKEQARLEWERDVQVWEQTRVARIAAATLAGAAASAQAYAQSLAATAPLVPLGVGIATTITGLIAANTALQIREINKSKPKKPAELRMATGGILAGAPHAAGGIDLEAEGGEGFLDRQRTKKFLDIADFLIDKNSGGGSNKIINLNFGERSVVVNDINAMVPGVIDKINRELAADVRRLIAV